MNKVPPSPTSAAIGSRPKDEAEAQWAEFPSPGINRVEVAASTGRGPNW